MCCLGIACRMVLCCCDLTVAVFVYTGCRLWRCVCCNLPLRLCIITHALCLSISRSADWANCLCSVFLSFKRKTIGLVQWAASYLFFCGSKGSSLTCPTIDCSAFTRMCKEMNVSKDGTRFQQTNRQTVHAAPAVQCRECEMPQQRQCHQQTPASKRDSTTSLTQHR